jgi:hypothetical protein
VRQQTQETKERDDRYCRIDMKERVNWRTGTVKEHEKEQKERKDNGRKEKKEYINRIVKQGRQTREQGRKRRDWRDIIKMK